MAEHGSYLLEVQKTEHAVYRKTVTQIICKATFGELQKIELQRFLAGWWRDHILESDMEYRDFIRETRLREKSTTDSIDAAIFAHDKWIARFQAVLKGTDMDGLDASSARDDSACVLGQWLQTESSLALLGADSHKRIMAIHATFHEIAGSIASMLSRHEHGNETEELLAELHNLSNQLVMLLMLTRKRSVGLQ